MTSFVTSMQAAHKYFTKIDEGKSRISNLRLRNQEFLSKFPRRGDKPYAINYLSRESLESKYKIRAIQNFTKTPKTIEDIDQLTSAVDNLKSKEIKELPEEKKSLHESRVIRFEKYAQETTDKELVPCLTRSLGLFSENTYEQKAKNLTNLWQVFSKVKNKGKHEKLFSILLYRLSKSVFGKGFQDKVTESQYLNILESIVNGTNCAADFMRILSSSNDQDHEGIFNNVEFERRFVDTLKSRINHLVERLADNGFFVQKVPCLFYSDELLEKGKVRVIKNHLQKTAILLKNLIIANCFGHPCFDKTFGKCLRDGLNEEQSTEEVRKTMRIVDCFPLAKNKYLQQVKDQNLKQSVLIYSEELVKAIVNSLQKYHRTKTLVQKDLLNKFAELLISN